jgi:uncharacterized protein (TIRG00374 family)
MLGYFGIIMQVMKKGSIRNIVIGTVIALALGVVFLRGQSFFELLDAIRHGLPLFLVLACLSQFCKYIAQSFGYSQSFKAVESGLMTPRICFPLVFGAFFLNTVAPSLNLSGNALFIDDAHRRGMRAGRATAAALLMQMSIETGFLAIMVAGFVIMAVSGDFTLVLALFGAVVVVLVAAMGGMLVLSHRAPTLLMRILRPIERLACRLSLRFRKKEMPPWADRLAGTMGDAAGDISKAPRKASMVFVLSLLASSFELGCFILTGMAFGIDAVPALIGGYVIAVLFTMVAITPMGLGVVEVAIVVLLTSNGISIGAATATALVFRGIVFWLPFALGVFFIRRTKTYRNERDVRDVKNIYLDKDRRDGEKGADAAPVPVPGGAPKGGGGAAAGGTGSEGGGAAGGGGPALTVGKDAPGGNDSGGDLHA